MSMPLWQDRIKAVLIPWTYQNQVARLEQELLSIHMMPDGTSLHNKQLWKIMGMERNAPIQAHWQSGNMKRLRLPAEFGLVVNLSTFFLPAYRFHNVI